MKKLLVGILTNNKQLLFLTSYVYNFFNISPFLNSFNNNRIIYKGSFISHTKFYIKGRNNIIYINPLSKLSNSILHIVGDNCRITIGKSSGIKNTELWIEDNNGTIEIGEFTTIVSAHMAATEGKSIKIGKDCMFSGQIQIRNGDSHMIIDKQINLRINPAEDILIGNHVWLSEGVKILKGSIISDNSVIGTGSIVTGFVAPNSIYIGIPAKAIKTDVYWDRERK